MFPFTITKLKPRKSREHWKPQKSTMLNEWNWRFPELYIKGYGTVSYLLNFNFYFYLKEYIFAHFSGNKWEKNIFS